MLLPRSLLRTHATAAAYVVRRPSIARPFHVSAALRAIDMSKVDTTERLAKLRKLMKERNVDVYSTKPRSSIAGDELTPCSGTLRGQPPERVHCPLRRPPRSDPRRLSQHSY